MLYKYNHTICDHWSWLFFTPHNAFETLVHITALLLLYHWAVFCGRDVPQLLYSSPVVLNQTIPVSSFWQLPGKLLWTVMYRFLCGHMLLFLCHKVPRNSTLCVKCVFHFVRNCHFPEQLRSGKCVWDPVSLYTCQHLVLSLRFILAVLIGMSWYISFLFLMPSDVTHLLMCFSATYMASSVTYLFMSVDKCQQCFFTAEFGGLELCLFVCYGLTAEMSSVKVS